MNSAAVSQTMRPMTLGPMPGSVPPGSMSSPINQDLHNKQTIDRLQCLQRHLKNPTTFERTTYELIEWCSDARAFQPQFHSCLMNCLKVVNDVVGNPGFDLDLCWRLLSLCYEQRDKLPSAAVGALGSWCNRVQKLMNMASQNLSGTSPAGGHMMNHKMGGYPQPHMSQRTHDHPGWNQSAQQGGPHMPNQHPSLSVITTATVWGVSTTQTPPVPVHSQSSSAYPHPHPVPSNMQSNFNNNYGAPHPKPNSCDSYHNSSVFPPGHRGMGPVRMGHQGPHINPDQSHHPQPAAAAAAAAVAAAAAAATATATATATFLKEHQDQNQMNSYEQMPSNAMPHNHMTDHMMHPGIPPSQHHMPPNSNRNGMHPMVPQANRVRGQMPHNFGRAQSAPTTFQMGPSPRPLTHNGPPMYNSGDPMYNRACRPQQPHGQPPFNGSPNLPSTHFNKTADSPNHMNLHRQASGTPTAPGYSPRLPGSDPSPIHPNLSQHQFYPQTGRPPHPEQMNSFPTSQSARPQFPPHYPEATRFSNCQPPIPGNPTPPLTPGSAHNVPPYPSSIPSVGMNDGKNGATCEPFFPPYQPGFGSAQSPSQPPGTDEMRLTFPVRDGIVLGPFRLEHNLAVSTHAFHLRENVFRTLSERPDLDLQFKCYHHDDVMKHTNWPHSVKVSVNANSLSIPRGMDRTSHKPLYLKKVCQHGRNSIEITVSACCCSHFFVLQLVHRPGIRFVREGLMYKRKLPEINCKTKISRHFASGAIASNNALVINGSSNEQCPTSVRVSLRCPITSRRIQIPARGQDCKHIQCFDLESYLQINSDNATWRCPICHKNALLEVLQVDEFIQNILKTLQDRDCHQVCIDANCNWTPLPMTSQHEPLSRNSYGPIDHREHNGVIKGDGFNPGNIKQEPTANHTGFGFKQEPLISALSIKQEPHKHRADFPIKPDPDGPPSKRARGNATSPGSSFPAPSPGNSMGYNKMTPDNSSGFPLSYDVTRCPGGNMTTSVSAAHPGNGFLKGGPAMPFSQDMGGGVAMNDLVPIEKRLNPAMSVGANVPGANNPMPGAGNPNIMMSSNSPGRRCMGNPKTPQGPGTPMRPPSSNVLTPQSIGISNNCSTPSSGGHISAPSSNNPTSTPGGLTNPATPVVTLPHSCDTLDPDGGLSALDSLLNGDDANCGGDLDASTLTFDTGGMKTDGLEIPDNDLMDMFPLNEITSPVTSGANPTAMSSSNTNDDDILSLFD